MIVNGLKVPVELESDLASGGYVLSNAEKIRFKELLSYLENPLPRLYDYDQIVLENQLWGSESARDYLGVASDRFAPGDVDPQRTLIIGEAEPDSPIALDFRTDGPRVVYLGDADHVSYWIQLSSDYRSLLDLLRSESSGPV